MTQQTDMIRVEHLSFGYGAGEVLCDLNFAVSPGEYVGLIGSNGAGKSTLLRLLLGELAPRRGNIRLFGQDSRHFREWPRIGYVPQNGAVRAAGFPATAEEVVLSSLYARIGPLRPPARVHREAAREALHKVGMADRRKSMIGALSGGQFQRVLLARALAPEPELLLLDEPSTGVDAQSAEELYELLARLGGEGITILMVTHDVARTAGYMHRALCLEQGSLVELDRQQLDLELQHRHRHP